MDLTQIAVHLHPATTLWRAWTLDRLVTCPCKVELQVMDGFPFQRE